MQPEQSARRRRVFRVLLPLVGLCLLGLLAWVLIERFYRPPKLDLIAIAVADYRNPEVPPIPYCYEDLEALRDVLKAEGSGQSSLWNDATSEGFAELGTALRETSNSHDNVLLYIKAHGVSLNGEAVLLGGDFELGIAGAGRLPVKQLLNHVAESPAKNKLLVLDTGHLESDPRMGMLTNEFTHLLSQAVQSLPADSNVWVLTSNSLFERAQVSLEDKRSAFGYYLAEGLKGRADGVLAQKNGEKAADRLIQLDELYRFVRDYVVQYVRLTSDDRQTQTPLLLRSGTGEVTDPPHEILLRIEAPDEIEPNVDEEKPVAWNGPQGLFRKASALALLGNQAPSGAATDDPAKATAAQPETTAAAQDVDEKTPQEAGKDAKPGGEATPQTTKGEAKTKAATENAKSAEKSPPVSSKEAAQKPAAPPRTPLEKSLFDYDTWLHQQQSLANDWRPTDYAPDLARLYYESLAGCRDRFLAGDLFLTSADYQVSLDRKLKELSTLQDAMAVRLKEFRAGVARPTYERDEQIRAAIRARNDACHLLPHLVKHHAAVSENTDPTMQRELLGLIEATLELDRWLAVSQSAQKPSAQSSFEGWKQTLNTRAGQARGHLNKLRDDFQARYAEQQRLMEAGGNPYLARQLADLAQSPLATPERREELQRTARDAKIARSFAEVEKQASQPPRPLPATEHQRLTDLAWGRVAARGELELAIAALALGDKQDASLTAARQSFAEATQTADVDVRLAELRELDGFFSNAYRKAPERLSERLRSKNYNYNAARAAETAIRLADARDQKRIDKILSDRNMLDPIADLRLAALPDLATTYRLALGDASSGSGGTFALNFGAAEKLAVRFFAQPALPGRLRLRLKYNAQRLQIKDAQGAAIGLDNIRDFPLAADGAGGTTAEHRLELSLESRDESGEQTSLTVSWLDENNRQLDQATIKLAHPQRVFAKLAVYGQPFTAEHTWQTTPQDDSYFDVPFNESIGHVKLLPFSGHTSRYDFRLTNAAKYNKKYAVAVYAIPNVSSDEPRRSLNALVAAAVRANRVLGRSELSLDAGRTNSIRFDSPPAASKDPAAAAKSEGDKLAAAKEPPPDVTAGLVCVLTEATKPGTGGQPSPAERQVIVIEADVQPPQLFITPRLVYRNGEIAAVLNVPDVNRLPAGGAKVQLVVQSDQILPDPSAKYVTQLTPASRADTLRAFVRGGTASQAKVSLHVDDYPRAFIYELPLDASLQDVERKLDLYEIALPDEKDFPVYREGKVDAPVGFPFSVDLPPAGDPSNRVRVFIAASPTSEYDRSTQMLESFTDRDHKIELLKVEDAPALALRARTSDLHATLDLSAYENQPIYVRVQLVGARQGEETVLADKYVKVYLDGIPPTLSATGPTKGAEEKIPFTVRINARDDISGIQKVEFALEKQANPDPKSVDKEVLVKPASKGIRLVGDVYQLTYTFEKPGLQSLFVQATDRRGNKSEIEEVEINVRPTPTAVDNKGATIPVAQFGEIRGRAGFPPGGRGKIESVILKDAGGRVVNQKAPADNGSFVFEKLAPGPYTVEAQGVINNVASKPAPVSVTVEAGKPARPIEVLMSR